MGRWAPEGMSRGSSALVTLLRAGRCGYAVISEVAEEIYRINVELPGKPVTVSMFVIDDELPDEL